MKTVSAGFNTHLQGSVTRLARCYKVKRTDGVILGFTDHDLTIAYDLSDGDGSINYLPSRPVEESAIENEVGTEVPTVEFRGIVDNVTISDADFRAGLYDFAEVKVFDVIWDDLALGEMKQRIGYVGKISQKDQLWSLEVKGLVEGLENEIVPLATAACQADFADLDCGINGATFTFSTTVSSVTDNQKFIVSDPDATETRFQSGMVTWTSGNNNGLKMDIKTWNEGTNEIVLLEPMPFTVAASDGLNMRTGCQKDVPACVAYANLNNYFLGFPYVPGNDVLFKTPDAPS